MKSLVIFLLFVSGSIYGADFFSHKEIVSRMGESINSKSIRSSIDSDEMRRRANLSSMKDLLGKDYKNVNQVKAGHVDLNRKGADYRYRDTPIKNQWNGSCTTFGGVAGLENLLNDTSVDMSERDSWSKYKQYSAVAFIKALSKIGNEICNENEWGQNDVEPSGKCLGRYRLGYYEALGDSVNDALNALDSGSVVYLAMSTPEDMLSCRSVIRSTSKFSTGGHAILIVGYAVDKAIDGGGYFIIKNSWGADCGDSGYQYIPFSTCQRADGYCAMWELRRTTTLGRIEPKVPVEPKYKWVQQCTRKWYWAWLKKKCEWVRIAE